jgi:hypothetical protein
MPRSKFFIRLPNPFEENFGSEILLKNVKKCIPVPWDGCWNLNAA